MAHVFLSYSRSDLNCAQDLALAMIDKRWSVWWDQEMRAGDEFRDLIMKELTKANCVVVLWSSLSVASRFVLDEASAGLEQNKLIPLTLDGTKPPLGFGQLQTFDLSSWVQNHDRSSLSDFMRQLGGFFDGIFSDEKLDTLSISGLAKAEHSRLAKVWVYALKPLELGVDDHHLTLRRKVFENLCAGVKYTYFVDSSDGIDKIRMLLDQMAIDYGGKDRDTKLATVLRGTTIVVLEPTKFLTHYCVHHHKNGNVDVFQDLLRSNDNHVLIRVDKPHAAHILWLMTRLIDRGSRPTVRGIHLRWLFKIK